MTDISTWSLDVVSCPREHRYDGQRGRWRFRGSEAEESLAPSAKGLQALEYLASMGSVFYMFIVWGVDPDSALPPTCRQ